MAKINTITFKVLLLASMILLASCSSDQKIVPAPLVKFTPTLTVKKLWASKIDDGTSKHYLKLTPVIKNEKIIVASYKGIVVKLDIASGKKIKSLETKEYITSGLAADDNLIFLGTAKGEILAISQDTLNIIWRAQVSNEVLAAPTISSNKLLVLTEDGNLYALNRQDGHKIWEYNVTNPNLILRTGSSPQVGKGLVIVGFADGQVLAVNDITGEPSWQRALMQPQADASKRMTDITANPIIAADVVYIATYQGQLLALELQTGNIIWQQPISCYAGFTIDDRLIYMVDSEDRVNAFDRATGKKIWQQDALAKRQLTAPVLFNNTLAIGDQLGYIHLLSLKDGHFIARQFTDSSGIIATPISFQNRLYIYTNSGEVVTLE